MTNLQLELSLVGGQTQTPPPQREQRRHRATWWFTQMRQIVSQAIDWEAAPPQSRPEQPWLGISHPRQST